MESGVALLLRRAPPAPPPPFLPRSRLPSSNLSLSRRSLAPPRGGSGAVSVIRPPPFLRPRLHGWSPPASASASPEPYPAVPSRVEEASFGEFVTSERVKVAAMLSLALALCNADRVVMSVAIVPLSRFHGWSTSFAGIVQSAFLWGYLISPIIGGTLVDYFGGKPVLAYGVALWSMATLLTPWAASHSLWALLAVRVLLGAAEGVALPCTNKMVLRWFPTTERSRAIGIAMAGFQLGSAIGLLLSPIIMSRAGTFGPFFIFGPFGFLWVLIWLSAVSSTPHKHPQISSYELEYITASEKLLNPRNGEAQSSKIIPPFRKLLSKWPTWALISANAMHSWGYFVFLSWMPLYFNTMYHVNLREAAWFSAVPWVVMAGLGYLAGAASDMLIRQGISTTTTRKMMQSVGFIAPGIALLCLNAARSPGVASAWLTVAVGLKSFSHSGFLVNIQEVSPQYAGVLHGIANTGGTAAAILGTVSAGFFVERVGSFNGFLFLTSFLYFSSALFWNFAATGKLVDYDAAG